MTYQSTPVRLIKTADGSTPYIHIKYSNDGGLTFTASNGETPGDYMGVCADYAIADPTDVSKYKWSKIKGDPGNDGENGTSVTILGSYDSESALNAAHPSGSIGDGYIVNGDLYVWSGSAWLNVGTIQGPQGKTGATGTGVASITAQYYLSTSKTTQTGGSWQDTMPTWVKGKYLWTRSKIVYTNPSSIAYTTPICDTTWESVDDLATQIDAKLELKLGKDENDKVVSMLNASAEVIRLLSNRLIIQSSGFALDGDGNMTATSGTVGGLTLSDKTLSTTFRKDFTVYTYDQITAIQNKMIQVGLGNATWTEAELDAYDLDMDGRITSVDILVMNKMRLGTESTYTEGKITIDATSPDACIRIEVTGGYRAGDVVSVGLGGVKTKGLSVTGVSTFDGKATFNGNADFNAMTTANAAWTFNSYASFYGQTKFDGTICGYIPTIGSIADDYQMAAGDDANNYLSFGDYGVKSHAIAAQIANLPVAKAGKLRVRSGQGGKASGAYAYLIQEYCHLDGPRYLRYIYTSGTAGDWSYGPWMSDQWDMMTGTEYCTLQRWNGKAVYTAVIDFGKLPSSGTTKVAHGLDIAQVVDISGFITNGTEWNPITMGYSGQMGAYCYVDATNVAIKTSYGLSSYSAYVTLKYTKA